MTDSCGNLPMVRPWKLPLKDKILISGQPGAYAKKKQKILNALLLMLTWLLHALSSSSSPIALPPLLFF